MGRTVIEFEDGRSLGIRRIWNESGTEYNDLQSMVEAIADAAAAEVEVADEFHASAIVATELSSSTTGATDVTGCSFTFEAGKAYHIEFSAIVKSALTSTGLGFALNTDVAPAHVAFQAIFPRDAAGNVTTGWSKADAEFTAPSTGAPSADTNFPLFGQGMLIAAATGGTCQLQYNTEVTGSAVTIRAGAIFRVMEIAIPA